MTKIFLQRLLTIAAVALPVVTLHATPLLACPNCKDGLAQSHMAQGYFWSILFMMSMPFLIVGGLGAYFYWEVRRARARAAAAQAAAASQTMNDSENARPRSRKTVRHREPVEV